MGGKGDGVVRILSDVAEMGKIEREGGQNEEEGGKEKWKGEIHGGEVADEMEGCRKGKGSERYKRKELDGR